MADNLTPKEEFLLNPVTEHNITDAAIATFETNFRHPVKVEIPFGSKQDLHGMDHPYPAGASVNLIPDGTDTENGYVAGYYLKDDGTTAASTNWYISEYFEVDPATTYTWSNRVNTSIAPSICFYDENKNYISSIVINKQYSHTFVPPEGAVYVRSSQSTYAYQAANPNGNAFQLEVGSTATPYQRYSNICPINGWTGITINRCGKNLFSNYSGDNSTFYLPKGTNFVASDKCANGGGYVKWRYADGVQDSLKWLNEGASSDGLSHYRRFGATNKDITSAFFFLSGRTLSECQIEIGSQFTAYEPFNKTILPITFTDPSTGDPMTVYGGTITLNEDGSADLICRVGAYVITGNETWTKRSDTVYRLQSRNTGVGIYTVGNSKCNYFKTTTGYDPTDGFFSISAGGNMTYVSFCAPSFLGTSTTACQAKAKELYDNGTPIIFCSNLRTPKTYHFPNVGQLKAFLGVNNIWSDAGNVNVKYLTQNSETGMEYRGDRALELRRRAMIADALTIHTTTGSEETGGLASFKSYIKAPVKKIEIPFYLKQEGTGDPSPDNVRPISGWTSATIYHTGKNVWGGRHAADQIKSVAGSKANFSSDDDGDYISLGGVVGNPNQLSLGVKFKPNTAYTLILKARCSANTNFTIRIYYTDGTQLALSPSATYSETQIYRIVTDANKTVRGVYTLNRSQTLYIYYDYFGLFEGSISADDYESYQDLTLPINWETEAGTVYGGSITLNEDGSSDLVVINFGQLASSLTWEVNRNYSNTFNGAGFTNRKLSIDGSNARGCYCDTYQWYTSTEVGAQTAGIALANAFTGNLANRSRIYVKDSRFSAVGDFVASFATHDPLIVCPLATPATYHFDNIGQLRIWLGENNFWCDISDNITVKYWNRGFGN